MSLLDEKTMIIEVLSMSLSMSPRDAGPDYTSHAKASKSGKSVTTSSKASKKAAAPPPTNNPTNQGEICSFTSDPGGATTITVPDSCIVGDVDVGVGAASSNIATLDLVLSHGGVDVLVFNGLTCEGTLISAIFR